MRQAHISGALRGDAGGYSYPTCFCCPNDESIDSLWLAMFEFEHPLFMAPFWCHLESLATREHWTAAGGKEQLFGGHSVHCYMLLSALDAGKQVSNLSQVSGMA